MTTNYKKVEDFHKAFGARIGIAPYIDNSELLELRWNLIQEEFVEVEKEIFDSATGAMLEPGQINLAALAKELADVLYVVYGFGVTFGVDMDAVFAEVHDSNMSKLGPDGKPVRRSDGKILKGPFYKAADIEKVLDIELTRAIEKKQKEQV